MLKDYYRILGVDRKASIEEIKRAYRELASRYHPDVNPSPEATVKMAEINEAYSVLGNPMKKLLYDRRLLAQQTKAKEEKMAEKFFVFSPGEILNRLSRYVNVKEFSTLDKGGFDGVFRGRRFLKKYTVFMKVVDQLSGEKITSEIRRIRRYQKEKRVSSSQTHLVIVTKGEGFWRIRELAYINDPDVVVSVFVYTSGRFYYGINTESADSNITGWPK